MKKNRKFWAALIIFSLTGQVAWVVENMYFNVFIYKMFRASAADIALMVTASSVAATLTTILIGALSDRIGKRKTIIVAGYLLWGLSVMSFGLVSVEGLEKLMPAAAAVQMAAILVIVLDSVMTFFGSSANDAAFNAWVTDVTDDKNR